MKHEVTSLNTNKQIAASLKKLMKEKTFSKITVSEIVADCNINRKTFYYHFEDIYALLKWIFDIEAIEIVKHFDLLNNYEEALSFILDYIEDNDYIIQCAFDSIGREEMKRFFYSDFISITTSIIAQIEQENNIHIDKDYKHFLCVFYTEALAGILQDWIKDRKERKIYTREQVMHYVSYTVRNSLEVLISGTKDKNIVKNGIPF